MKWLASVSSFLTDLIKYISPIIIIIFALLVFASMLKWSNRIRSSLTEVFKSPIVVLFWIATTVLLLFLFYEHVYPLLS